MRISSLYNISAKSYLLIENLDACVIGNFGSFILVGPYSLHWVYKGTINKKKKWNSGAERNKDVLELIHTYIIILFLMDSWNEQTYFIMFIDDSSLFKVLTCISFTITL